MVFSFQFISIYLCLELTNNINRQYISTMGKRSNNTNKNKGFTLVEVLLLIVVLILVGGLGYLGFKQVNKKSTTSSSSTTATTAKTAAVDPYAGWKTGTLKYEKITFKYPADWTLTDYPPSLQVDNADTTLLASPSGNVITLRTGIIAGGSPMKTYASVPITFLGKPTQLKIQASSEGSLVTGTPDQPTGAAVSGGFIPAKNITQVCNVNQVCPTDDYFSYSNGPKDSSNNQPVYKSVSSMENNPDFSKAKLIFESMHY